MVWNDVFVKIKKQMHMSYGVFFKWRGKININASYLIRPQKKINFTKLKKLILFKTIKKNTVRKPPTIKKILKQ